MSYSAWDYLVPTVGVFVIAGLLQLSSCVYFAAIKKTHKYDRRLIFVPLIFTLLFMFTVVLVLSSAVYVGPLLGLERATITGTVENIRSGVIPLYWNRITGRLTSPSFISVSGMEYYILSDFGLSIGDHIALEYCPDGRAILKWNKVTANTMHQQQLPIVPTEPAQQQFGADNIVPIITNNWIIILFCFTILILFLFNKPLAFKRLEYINRNDFYAEGLVFPRKISVMNCTLEFISTTFLILSLFAHNIAFTVFQAAIVGCLWFMRILTQKTMIQYSGDRFIYMTAWSNEKYDRSSVADVQLSKTKHPGFKQLIIQMIDGKKIYLEELNYTGIYEFYAWLQDRGRFCVNPNEKQHK